MDGGGGEGLGGGCRKEGRKHEGGRRGGGGSGGGGCQTQSTSSRGDKGSKFLHELHVDAEGVDEPQNEAASQFLTFTPSL